MLGCANPHGCSQSGLRGEGARETALPPPLAQGPIWTTENPQGFTDRKPSGRLEASLTDQGVSLGTGCVPPPATVRVGTGASRAEWDRVSARVPQA